MSLDSLARTAYTEDHEAFRSTVRAWLDANAPKDATLGTTDPPPHKTLLESLPSFSSTPSQPAPPPGIVRAKRPMNELSADAMEAAEKTSAANARRRDVAGIMLD